MINIFKKDDGTLRSLLGWSFPSSDRVSLKAATLAEVERRCINLEKEGRPPGDPKPEPKPTLETVEALKKELYGLCPVLRGTTTWDWSAWKAVTKRVPGVAGGISAREIIASRGYKPRLKTVRPTGDYRLGCKNNKQLSVSEKIAELE